jgi:DHA2 family multidrug resistance protein
MAFLFVPLNTLAFSYMPKRLTNSATGLINLARNIGGSTGIAAVATMLARRAQFHQHQLVAHLTPMHQGYRDMLDRAGQFLILQGDSPADAAQRAHGLLYGILLRESAMKAFIDAFWMLAVIFLVMAPLMFLMRRVHHQRSASA